jgi:hypothetical protein
MDTLGAYMRGQAALAAGAKQMVFDWDKAARIISARKPKTAQAGLLGDYDYTIGTIWRDGKIVEDDTDSCMHLASNWAMPMLILDYEEIECFIYGDQTEWDAHTKWPISARKIVEK